MSPLFKKFICIYTAFLGSNESQYSFCPNMGLISYKHLELRLKNETHVSILHCDTKPNLLVSKGLW